MKPTTTMPRFLLKAIVILYLLLFLTGLMSSGYLLLSLINLKPIILIGLLKYLLLCILFTILIANTVKTISLKPKSLYHLAQSTKNFKWLFCIALLISVAAKSGLFNTAVEKPIVVTWIQIGVLTGLSIFCFWSDVLLQKEKTAFEEEEVEKVAEENTEA